MVASYNQALDVLAENLRWMLTQRGIEIVQARAQYLADNGLSDVDADSARQAIVQILTAAEPVFWPKRFCSIIEQSFATLPTSWRLTDPMLFTPNGYVHFEQPLSLRTTHPPDDVCMGAYDRLTGLGWRKVRGTLFVDLVAWISPGSRTLVEVFDPEWMHGKVDPRIHAGLDRIVRKAQAAGTEIDLTPEETFDRVMKVLDSESAQRNAQYRGLLAQALQQVGVVRAGGIPWMITPWRSGQTLEQTATIHRQVLDAKGESCTYCVESYMRAYGTCLNFLSTKVLVNVRSDVDRAVTRRLTRNGPAKPQWDRVNVITMRRAERITHESDAEHTPVDWAGHWLVGSASGGFWRRQPVKNADKQWTYEWRWIFPYIKGNLDKPFMPPKKRIWNVTR